VVREHRNYLSSVCSYLCVDQFCASITMDRISEYEKTYTNYWRVHTSCLLESTQSSEYEQHAALAQCIREDLQKARERILSTAPNRADTLTLEELRRPTGDTVKMKVLGVNFAVPGLGRSRRRSWVTSRQAGTCPAAPACKTGRLSAGTPPRARLKAVRLEHSPIALQSC
jgi:hypothetical protein